MTGRVPAPNGFAAEEEEARGEAIVFGMLKRGGEAHAEIAPDASEESLASVARGHAPLESVMRTDGWRGCGGLADAPSVSERGAARTNSPEARGMSMGWNHSGAMRRGGQSNLTASRKKPSSFI